MLRTEWWKSCCKKEYRKNNKKKWWQASLRDLWDIKHTNIHIIGVPQGEEKDKGPEKITEEITVENVPNMGKEIVNKIEEAQSSRQDKPKEEHMKTHSNQKLKIKIKY